MVIIVNITRRCNFDACFVLRVDSVYDEAIALPQCVETY